MNYAWGELRQTDYARLTLSKLMTRTLGRLDLPPESEGKILSCAVRWQNSRGGLGPWSEIQHIVVV